MSRSSSHHQDDARKHGESLEVDNVDDTHLDVALFKANMPKYNGTSSHGSDGTHLDVTCFDSTESFSDEDNHCGEEIIEFEMSDGTVISATIDMGSDDAIPNAERSSLSCRRGKGISKFVSMRRIRVTRRRRSLYCLLAIISITLVALGIHYAIQFRKPKGLVLGNGEAHVIDPHVVGDGTN